MNAIDPLEVLKAFARTSGSFAVFFKDGRALAVRGPVRERDYPFLRELAEEGTRNLGIPVRVLHVGPTETRVL